MLQNAYLLAKIGADTAENERNKKLPKIGNYPTGRGLRGDEAQQVRVLGPGGVRAARRAVEAEDQDLDSLLRTILFLTCNYMFSYVHDM